MKNKLLFIKILLLFTGILLFSCKSNKVIVDTQKSSINNSIHRVTEYIYIVDTIETVVLPVESSRNVLFKLDTSILETSLAFSIAWIDTNGFLHHEIKNKPTAALPMRIEYRYKDTNDSINNSDLEYQKEIQIVVENKLTWWQKTQIRFFWISLLLLLFAYRKQILKIMKKIIGL